jgi:hypothetical protein
MRRVAAAAAATAAAAAATAAAAAATATATASQARFSVSCCYWATRARHAHSPEYNGARATQAQRMIASRSINTLFRRRSCMLCVEFTFHWTPPQRELRWRRTDWVCIHAE